MKRAFLVVSCAVAVSLFGLLRLACAFGEYRGPQVFVPLSEMRWDSKAYRPHGEVLARWSIIDLKMPAAYGINNAGEVLGDGVIWVKGRQRGLDLSSLCGPHFFLSAINDLGQVIGYCEPNSGVSRDFAGFFVDRGALTRLPPAAFGSVAADLNDRGIVVGFSIGEGRAEIWNLWSGPISRPAYISGQFRGINNKNEVVGDGVHLVSPDGEEMPQTGAVVLDLEAGTIAIIPGLDKAAGINDRGQIVGITPQGRAALWNGQTLTDIGPADFGESAVEKLTINNRSQVVGAGLVDAEGPYLFDNGTAVHLNALVAGTGWTITKALGINDSGEIVGIGVHDGSESAFLLRPTFSDGDDGGTIFHCPKEHSGQGDR